ncbi:glycosyltransferase family 2 protein [Kordiimonas sp.]|uniref:glycosyltransferase family 2 protein n=1 Tax=Kordiimonas sp. TaxID=1970157 RepID=UPI003A932C9F
MPGVSAPLGDAASDEAQMQANPPIGIVIPAYGHPRFLGEAIISACTQETSRQIYVVVVDDGCRFQETAELVGNLMGQFPGMLHYVRHKNTRLPGARNKGVRFLTALCPEMDSVFFLDADNRLSPYSIEAYRKALGEDTSIGWAYPDIAFFGLSWGQGGFDIRESAPDYSVLKHLCGNISEAGSLVRASVFRNGVFYDDTMRSGFEDWDFWLSALGAGYRGKRVKDAGFLYRRRAESMLADSRREEELLISRLKAKHKALFDPQFIMQMTQIEAPFFAILQEDQDTVLLTSDPTAEPIVLSTEEFAARMVLIKKSPQEYFAPRKVVSFAPGVWAVLKEHAPRYLRWLFWMLLRDTSQAKVYSITKGPRPALQGGMPGEGGHFVVYGSDPFSSDAWDEELAYASDCPHENLALPIECPIGISVFKQAAAIGRHLPKENAYQRHNSRRYAGPATRKVFENLVDPACSADDEYFAPVPWVKEAGERWFAFVAAGDEVNEPSLLSRIQAARAKGYRILLILEREEGVEYKDLPAVALDTADMVVPLYLEPSTGMSRYYLGRSVQSVMSELRQLEVETLAIHFDYLEVSHRAMCLEAFGVARHRGVKTHLVMPSYASVKASRAEDFGRVLAYEHAIDCILTDDAKPLALVMSAQGIPREKFKETEGFFSSLPPAWNKSVAPAVMAKPLNWAPSKGYLFVVTYGRSGSTLLQTVLQSIDGYFIRGENENALYPVFEAWRCARHIRQRYDTTRPVPKHGPWYGAEEVDADAYAARLIDAFVAQVICPPEDARVVGFKEIRYCDLDATDLEEFLEFIRTFFPQCRFIFNMRNSEDVARSGWWQDQKSQFVHELVSRSDAVFKRFAGRYPDVCHLMQYEDYAQDISGIRPLFEFLQEEIDEQAVVAMMKHQLDH